MQVLQQYANGMNPEVPPYLALGELQRREMSQKQAATAQGGQQGPQPSIKEQVEQKAGLMALQQMQQQQAAQQMQQPRGPMPAPAGVPQPDAQPEAMMARGGLAGIPVRRDMFDFQRGGIVAFSGKEGSQVKEETEQEKKERIAKALQEYMRKNNGELPAGLKAAYAGLDVMTLPGRALMGAANTGVVRPLRAMGADIPYIPESMFMGDSGSMTPAYDELRRAEAIYRADQEREKNMRAVRNQGENMHPTMQNDPRIIGATPPDETVKPTSSAPPKVIATPLPGGPRPPAAAPAGAQTGIAAALPQAQQGNVSPYFAKAAASAEEKPIAPTPESIIAEQKKLLPAGMQEEGLQKMFADQRARAEGRQAAYEKSKPSGMDDLVRVWGQAAQYKGGTGLAPAYTAMQQQRRSEDMAMQKQQDELLTAIEGRQYGADKELFGARKDAMTAANKSYQDRLTTNTKALADLAGVDQRRMDEAANRLTQVQIAKLREATANKPTEAERIEANYMALIAKNKPEEAEAYLNRISRIKGGGTAGVGADNAETRRLREAMKDIDARLEFMDANNPEYKTLQATRDKLSKRVVERAIGETGVAPAGNAPKIGDVQQGYRFKGGNPADQSNWEKVK